MQLNRLPVGGRIDRNTTLNFQFNGKSLQGHAGDTLASALLANDVKLINRSIKYHRPRGIIGIGAEEPNALLQLESGGRTLANCRATQIELYEGLTAKTVNGWPSLHNDFLAINGMVAQFLPAGFYYKTFMWPKRGWRKYEHQIRKIAGLGIAPDKEDPDYYDKCHAHCDVMVIGGGAAGLAAALEAGRAGARVILVDDQAELGGQLLNSREIINGRPATEWVAQAVAELSAMPDVRLLSRSTVFGYYDHNFLAVLERVTDHLPSADSRIPRQRLWHVRAKQVVIASGSFERPLVFHNNDRPGIMLASAVSGYLNHYAVRPGSRAVVFTNNDSAYQTALDLLDAGSSVIAVVDSRDTLPDLAAKLKAREVPVYPRSVVTDTFGSFELQTVEISQLTTDRKSVAGKTQKFPCDLLAVSGGWTPALDMYGQSGGKTRFDAARSCFVPGPSAQAERSAGSCNGNFALSECLREGSTSGAQAAQAAGFGDGRPSLGNLSVQETKLRTQPMWVVPSRYPLGRGPKQFVDFQNDTSAADILMAARENFQSIEHVKRYTLLGFGTDQGKLSNVNGIGVLSIALNKDMGSIGTTTFRPAYTPVTFGALAGRDVGALADPLRKTPMDSWHVKSGAIFENVGQWRRPLYYAQQRGEKMHDAVRRECLATQQGIGVLDASTLGKIDVQGPDAVEFFNRIYTNSKSTLKVGRCSYGLMLGEDGMVFDDGVTARLAEQHFVLTTTSGGAARVMSWLERWLQTEWPHLKVYMTSVTDHWGTISINGPKSRSLLSELSDDIDFSREAFPFMSVKQGHIAGIPARVFRISFSGELAYEINVPASYVLAVWEKVFEAGAKYGITPYGTEAMHVLRAEKGYVIVGQDTDGSLTPGDLGMDWIMSKKNDFLGKRSLSRTDTAREGRKQLVGLLPESPQEVLPEGAQIIGEPKFTIPAKMLGHVTSSYQSARVGRSIALAVLKAGRSRIGDSVYIPLREGKVVKATVTEPIFYDIEGKLQNA